MGLDMYLIRKKYVGAEYKHRNVKGKIEITINGKVLPIEFDRVSYIEEQVGYWRKANAIHKWFVDNIQNGEDDCKNYYVNIDNLEELLNKCKEVKEKAIIKNMVDGEYIENADEIADILPTQEGFFFGSTKYDEYYMKDINYTIELIEKLLKEEEKLNKLDFYSEFEYSSSW